MLDRLDKNDRVLILSPHLDDAVLSAGGLMDRAAKSGVSVIACTLFTANADIAGELSPLVKELHEWWGLGSNPYEVRRAEDIAAVKLLDAAYLHGGLLDSIYRSAEGQSLYGTRKAVFSPPDENDPAWDQVESLLARWFDEIQPTVVLCPMAVGRHLDHVVTTETLRRSFGDLKAQIYLYEDIPYSAGFFPRDFPDSLSAALERTSWKIKGEASITVDFDRKFSAIKAYGSQLAEIFPGLDAEQELRRYMAAPDGQGYRERFWAV